VKPSTLNCAIVFSWESLKKKAPEPEILHGWELALTFDQFEYVPRTLSAVPFSEIGARGVIFNSANFSARIPAAAFTRKSMIASVMGAFRRCLGSGMIQIEKVRSHRLAGKDF